MRAMGYILAAATFIVPRASGAGVVIHEVFHKSPEDSRYERTDPRRKPTCVEAPRRAPKPSGAVLEIHRRAGMDTIEGRRTWIERPAGRDTIEVRWTSGRTGGAVEAAE